jgi:hypothetical protein
MASHASYSMIGRMPSGSLIAWVVVRFKSLPAIVMRAIVANLLSTFDLASDLYTIESLFALGHHTPAYALLTMVCLSFAAQVGAGCGLRCSGAARLTSALWQRMGSWTGWFRRCSRPSS